MTISSQVRSAGPFIGTGAAVAYPFAFKIFQPSDLRVMRTDTAGDLVTLALGTDYTVAMNSDQNATPGGTVSLNVPLPDGYTLSVTSQITAVQLASLLAGGAFSPTVIENALDRLTILQQQLGLIGLVQALRVPEIGGVQTLPSAASRASRILAFDSDGGPITIPGVDSGSAAALALDLASSASGKGDALLAVKKSAIGALATTQHEVNERRALHLFDFLTSAQRADVLAGSSASAVAVTAAINTAISAASALRCWLDLPPCTIYVTPATARTDEAGSNICCFPSTSYQFIRGTEGVTTLKITDGVSSDASPRRFSMFLNASAQLVHQKWRGVIFDMNGANNRISPSRPGSYNVFTQAAILNSGTPGGGVAACSSYVEISHCQFINTAGVTCIGMMQSNTAGVTLGRHWHIHHCRFWNNGLDTQDHSSIYAWTNDVWCHDCEFGADTIWGTVGSTGGNVAFEFHGANQWFYANRIHNYNQMVWMASNYTSAASSQHCFANTATNVRSGGVDIERGGLVTPGAVSGLYVHDNQISLTDDAVLISLKFGVQLNTTYAISDLNVYRNTILKTGAATAAVGVYIASASTAANVHDGIYVEDNTVAGATFGVAIATSATNGLGRLQVTDNEWRDLTPGGAFPTAIGVNAANINAAGPVKRLTIGNDCSDTRGSPLCSYGAYLSGAITTLERKQDSNTGNVVADYIEASATITNRTGMHNNVPVTPTWYAAGAAITLGNGSVQGSYSTAGDQVTYTARLTVGSTTSFGAGGTLSVSLPAVSQGAGVQYMGAFRLYDASAGTWVATGISEVDGGAPIATMQLSGGGFVGSASPLVLAVGDVVSLQITYRRA